jgi:hypothetical protein
MILISSFFFIFFESFPIDWKTMSLDVRQHPYYSRQCRLASWEINLAKPLKKTYLEKDCSCHVEKRLEFKYMLIAVNLLLMLLVTTHNPYIAKHILQYITLQQLSIVAVYLPLKARQLLVAIPGLIETLVYKDITTSNLNLDRLKDCLTFQNSKGLLNELEGLKSFTFDSPAIDEIPYMTGSLQDAAFNPRYPIIASITHQRILTLYCYKNPTRPKGILYIDGYPHTSSLQTLSWSDHGLYLYYFLFDLSSRETTVVILSVINYTIQKVLALPIASKMSGARLWLNNNTLLFCDSDRPPNHLSCLRIYANNKWIKGSLDLKPKDRSPLHFTCLTPFTNITQPTCVKHFPDLIFLITDCPLRNPSDYAHHCVVVMSIKKKKVLHILHCPGRVFNMTSNSSRLVIMYGAVVDQEDAIYRSELTVFNTLDDYCPIIRVDQLPVFTFEIDVRMCIYNPQNQSLDLRDLYKG